MVVLGINSRAACFSHFHSRHCEINFFERRRRARIDAENGHRRVTRTRLRIIVKETRGYPTGYLLAQSDTIKYDREPHELSGSRADHEAVFGYIEVVSFELKRRPYKYFINFYPPLYEGLNNYFLTTKRCNHERLQKRFARPQGNEG